MAQNFPDSPKKHRPKFSGCFSACFRPPKKVNKEMKIPAGKPTSKNKGPWLISWSRKSPMKTSPDVLATEKKTQKIKKESFRVAKLSKKFSSSNHDRGFPVDSSASPPPGRTPEASGGDEVLHRQPDKARGENRGKMFSENSKENKGIFKRNCSLPAVNKISPVLSHSASMPPSTSSGKQPVTGGANLEDDRRKIGALTGRFDQLVGMSVLVVTLLIMVIWGKVCAILCTSAWLYFYPNVLRATKFDQPKHTKSLDLIESKKLKKKVVFEGFLETSHRG